MESARLQRWHGDAAGLPRAAQPVLDGEFHVARADPAQRGRVAQAPGRQPARRQASAAATDAMLMSPAWIGAAWVGLPCQASADQPKTSLPQAGRCAQGAMAASLWLTRLSCQCQAAACTQLFPAIPHALGSAVQLFGNVSGGGGWPTSPDSPGARWCLQVREAPSCRAQWHALCRPHCRASASRQSGDVLEPER